MEGQAVAKAQQSHHAAPVDTALKQAAGRGDAVAGDPWGGLLLPSPSHPFGPPVPISSLLESKNGLAVNWGGQRLPQPGLDLGRARVPVKGESSEGR